MTQKNVFCGQKVLKNIYNDIGINEYECAFLNYQTSVHNSALELSSHHTI